MYSNIRPRAGLVVFVFALIIQLVSAVPILTLAPQSGPPFTLSSLSNRHGQDLIQRDTGGINGPISIVSTTTGANNTPFDEDELVARKVHISNSVKKAFENAGKKIKDGFKKVAKVGMAIISEIEKVGSYVAKAIPGIGGIISKGLKIASKITGKISDAIHTKLSPKLDKATGILRKVL